VFCIRCFDLIRWLKMGAMKQTTYDADTQTLDPFLIRHLDCHTDSLTRNG